MKFKISTPRHSEEISAINSNHQSEVAEINRQDSENR